jgi:Transposase IS66 family
MVFLGIGFINVLVSRNDVQWHGEVTALNDETGGGRNKGIREMQYADHQPLYRQSEIYAREGVDQDRSTLAGWVGATSELLAPLVEAVRDHVMSASKLHADDTPVPVLAPGNGKTKTGRLWTYVRDDRPSGDTTAPAVWFAYSPDRKGENPRQHLKHYRGALQADAYAGFQHLYQNGTIVEVACWAHARRKFHEIHIAHPSPTTTEAIERIAALYAIEARSVAREALPQVRHRGRDPLRHLTLACPHPLRRRRHS